jgi:flotillin
VCQDIARATLEGHQRAIMGAMTVDEIFKDRKKFSEQVFDVASTDLVNMGFQVLYMYCRTCLNKNAPLLKK